MKYSEIVKLCAMASLIASLSACGGGGGGGSADNNTDQGTNSDASSNNDSGSDNSGSDDSGSDDSGSDGSDGSGSDNSGTGGGGSDNSGSDGEDSDDGLVPVSGLSIFAAEGYSYADTGEIEDINLSTVRINSGKVTFLGAQDGVRTIWYGSPGDLNAIVKAGDNIDGFAANVTFNNIEQIGLTGSGKAGLLIEPQGASTDLAYATIDTNGAMAVKFKVRDSVLRRDSMEFSAVLLESIYPSDAGVAIYGSLEDSPSIIGNTLWFVDNDGNAKVVARNARVDEDHNEPVLSNGCHIVYDSGVDQHVLADDGSLYFVGRVRGNSCEIASSTRLIVKYKDGDYRSMIYGGENILGAPGFTFESSGLRLLGLHPAGGIIVQADIDELSASISTSVWHMQEGQPNNLILMDNEKINTEIGDLEYNVGNHFGLNTTINFSQNYMSGMFDLANETQALAIGPLRTGLPYTDLNELGNSSLSSVYTSKSQVPAPFPATALFDFSQSTHSDDGTVYFTAQVTDAVDSTMLDESLWVKRPYEPEAERLLTVGDNIELGDVKAIETIDGLSSRYIFTAGIIGIDNDRLFIAIDKGYASGGTAALGYIDLP